MNCYRIYQKSLNFIYPFKFYSNFTNKNVSWLHFSWATQYITGIMTHFRYYKKKSFSFGPTRAIRDLCQISSASVDIWENDGRKTCFRLITEDARVIGYSKENLKIHTGVPSSHSLPCPPLSFFPSPAFRSLSRSPPFLYPLPLEVGPLKPS